MNLSCFAHLSKLRKKPVISEMHLYNDTFTRYYARNKITGALYTTQNYALNIMEGDYSIIEGLLDENESNICIQSPEILLVSQIQSRAFKNWTMHTLETSKKRRPDFSLLNMTALQAQSDPESMSRVISQLIKQFSELASPPIEDESKAA